MLFRSTGRPVVALNVLLEIFALPEYLKMSPLPLSLDCHFLICEWYLRGEAACCQLVVGVGYRLYYGMIHRMILLVLPTQQRILRHKLTF